jgi:signal transduction histidine kinase
MRDMVLLMLAAVGSAAIVSGLHVSLLCLAGLVSWTDYAAAALRYWIGDVIGIAVVTPFLLILLTRGRPLSLNWETAFQIAAIIAALWIVFATAAGQKLQLFYILFLPIVWIAVRTGLEGVSAGLVLTQVGLIVAIHRPCGRRAGNRAPPSGVSAATAAGRPSAPRAPRQHGRAGRGAGTRNQSAAHGGRYLCTRGHASSRVRHLRQVERAAEVVRRLRGLIQLGRSEIAPVAVGRAVQESLELLRPEIQRHNITVREQLARDLPLVMADVLQIQQVLINLIRNSIEAIAAGEMPRGNLVVEAVRGESGFIEMVVRDNGPGFAKEQLDRSPQAFETTKADGLGIGLSLSRSIIEAHGGRLWLGKATTGAAVHFTLPAAEIA